jgi:hypothetical protein
MGGPKARKNADVHAMVLFSLLGIMQSFVRRMVRQRERPALDNRYDRTMQRDAYHHACPQHPKLKGHVLLGGLFKLFKILVDYLIFLLKAD